jgi:hypothetical protein
MAQFCLASLEQDSLIQEFYPWFVLTPFWASISRTSYGVRIPQELGLRKGGGRHIAYWTGVRVISCLMTLS